MTAAAWQVGDVTITKVVELEVPLPGGGAGTMLPAATPDAILAMPWLVPDWATEEGHLRMSVHALLVETPSMRLVVDTCVGNDKPRENPFFNQMQTRFLTDLLAVDGWSRESVDGVVCTHLHTDHVGWNTMLVDGRWQPTFPNARYFVAATELDHWALEGDGDIAALLADSVQPLLDAGLLTPVATDAQLAPEVRLLPTPGHTPGHVSVVVESGGERALITGDVMHHPSQVARPDWSSDFDSDSVTATATREALLFELAGTGTLVIGTHFGGPTAGRVASDGGGGLLFERA